MHAGRPLVIVILVTAAAGFWIEQLFARVLGGRCRLRAATRDARAEQEPSETRRRTPRRWAMAQPLGALPSEHGTNSRYRVFRARASPIGDGEGETS
jgi:hypothetical protein